MLLGYGAYALSFAITGQSGSGAAFLTDSAALADGRSGSGTSLRWTNGIQNTSSYVEITVTIVSPFGEAAPSKGVAAIINAQGVPHGLKTVIGGITQRLAYGPRNELCAWVLPRATGTTLVIRLYNDDGTVTPPIAAAATIALGEIFVGRLIKINTLINSSPGRTPQDPTASTRSAGGQVNELLRKPWWQVGTPLGNFSIDDAMGGDASSIADGGNPAGKIDIKTLAMYLSTTRVCAICDVAHGSTSVTVDGITYDQTFMQGNWILARPVSIPGPVLSKAPKWSWSPQWGEAR
jgi:hypothetical protein